MSGRYRLAVAAATVVISGATLVPVSPAAAVTCDNGLSATTVTTAVPWAQSRLGFQRAWPITEGARVVVGVVDSGVDGGNAQLAGAVTQGPNLAGGVDFDCADHGTLVAGIIAARPYPGMGFTGVAPAASLVSVRVADAENQNSLAALADGITDAVNSEVGGVPVSVINVSLSTSVLTPQLRGALDYALAHDVLVVAAAGNEQNSEKGAQYPASYPGVLAVGAVDESGSRSSFTVTATPIGVVAPGSGIVSTGAGANGPGVIAGSTQGTSFAAPYVAGVAALVRAAHPKLSARQVIARIEATADRPAGPVPDPQYGWGMVDPYAAVTAVLPGETGARAVPPASARVPAVHPVPDTTATARHTADTIALGTVAAALAVAAATAAFPAARRRGWRPGRWSAR